MIAFRMNCAGFCRPRRAAALTAACSAVVKRTVSSTERRRAGLRGGRPRLPMASSYMVKYRKNSPYLCVFGRTARLLGRCRPGFLARCTAWVGDSPVVWSTHYCSPSTSGKAWPFKWWPAPPGWSRPPRLSDTASLPDGPSSVVSFRPAHGSQPRQARGSVFFFHGKVNGKGQPAAGERGSLRWDRGNPSPVPGRAALQTGG